jgi:hypothetical protein
MNAVYRTPAARRNPIVPANGRGAHPVEQTGEKPLAKERGARLHGEMMSLGERGGSGCFRPPLPCPSQEDNRTKEENSDAPEKEYHP